MRYKLDKFFIYFVSIIMTILGIVMVIGPGSVILNNDFKDVPIWKSGVLLAMILVGLYSAFTAGMMREEYGDARKDTPSSRVGFFVTLFIQIGSLLLFFLVLSKK